MSIIYFATSNKGKVAHAAAALKKFNITVKQMNIDLIESRSEDPEEIALEKARQAYSALKKPVIVEDSGFFITALGGFPKTHVKFSLQTLGIKNILKILSGMQDRSAEWRMSVAYVYGPKKYKTFTFYEKGEISKNIRPVKRQTMSDYWRIYIPKMIASNTRALSEMSDDNLKEWLSYYEEHNQFAMLGSWLENKK